MLSNKNNDSEPSISKNGLQAPDFLLDSRPMSRHKSLIIILSVVIFSLCNVGFAQSTEQPPLLGEEFSLFERHTNSAKDLILKGLELVGINYRRGGINPDSGLDCSGFVQVVFRDALGELLPRTAKEQSKVGDKVGNKNELKPGDLVFFNTIAAPFRMSASIWATTVSCMPRVPARKSGSMT
jgi:hypothetical protein